MRILRLLALVLFAVFSARAGDCDRIIDAKAGDSLAALATHYLGDADYGPAILLATNTRAGFKFIGDPDRLDAGAKVCIPTRSEADELRREYDPYLRAVAEGVHPRPAEERSGSLVTVDTHKPTPVVGWMRDKKAAALGAPGHWATQAPFEIWVTVEPHLQDFCRDFTRAHGWDQSALTRRLEQRLGLPPASNDTVFVEMEIDDPSASLFRPCADPAVNVANCPASAPPAIDRHYKKWFLAQYYDSYATATPWQYPWTALGYTFDWATDEKGSLVRYGESEFVIPAGAAINVTATTDLTHYCQDSK
jgi:hypothetical protein